jgi:hypothetical protein
VGADGRLEDRGGLLERGRLASNREARQGRVVMHGVIVQVNVQSDREGSPALEEWALVGVTVNHT